MLAPAAVVVGERAGEPRTGHRLVSIDALRGVAALGVVLFHTTGNTPWRSEGFDPRMPGSWLLLLNSVGFVGVYLFFVISGFCIHMRWARANAARPGATIDFKSFWMRRIQRLYPTYLIALALYLGARGFTHVLDLSKWGFVDIGAHVLMLHNLDERTALSICGVFWTLAVEEQLYLAYFLLLRLRGSLGWLRTLGVCLLARAAWTLLHAASAGVLAERFHFHLALPQAAAMHWFTWSLGAVGIEHATGLLKLPSWCRDLRLAAITAAAAAALHYALMQSAFAPGMVKVVAEFLVEPLWGAGFFFLVMGLAEAEGGWKRHGRAPALISGLAGLGAFSYSLYCTHVFVLKYGGAWIHGEDNPYRLMLLVPAAVAFAWLFYRVAEKPFIPRPEAR